jgi:DNA-binding GntR family transcriptional regulator
LHAGIVARIIRAAAGLPVLTGALSGLEESLSRTDKTTSESSDLRRVDLAYQDIRSRILDGELRPGSHLAEEQLALLTSTSRTPVREALRRLAGEGLVVTNANRRSYVAEFDPFEADAVFEIRARLESYACELAATRISRGALERLEQISDSIEALGPEISRSSISEFFSLNNQFHLTILETAGSRQLSIAVAAAVAIPLPLLKHYVWDQPVSIEQSNMQHREIIAALRAGNRRWAADCMASHINSTRPVAAGWDHARGEMTVRLEAQLIV